LEYTKPKVYAHGSYIGTGGYNQHTRDFFRHLSKLVDVKVRNFTIGPDWELDLGEEQHNKEKYINDVDKKLLCYQNLWIDMAAQTMSLNKLYTKYPNEFQENVNIVLAETNHHYFFWDKDYTGPKIGYNVWESTRQPDSFFKKWMEFDQLWVPSQWQRQCTIEQGADPNKVKVVPEGVDITTFYPEEVNHNDYNDGRFKFVLFGRWDYRKSTKEIIEAFLKTFDESEPVDLILSIDNKFASDGYDTTENRLIKNGFDDERLKVKHFPSREDYVTYLKKGHIFLSCARSEGWNLPLIEAMACGTPSIYSADTGQMEFAKGKGLPVKVIGEKSACSDGYFQFSQSELPGNFPEPDFDDLQKVMRDAYENYDKHKNQALEDAKIIHKEFNWDKVAQIGKDTIVEFLKNYNKSEDKNEIITCFDPSPKIEIKGEHKKHYKVEFINDKLNKVIYSDIIHNGMWSGISDNPDSISIKVDGVIIDSLSERLKNKTFLVKDLKKKLNHLIDLHSNSLGDIVAIMPYLDLYASKHNVIVYLRTNNAFNKLFVKSYPNIIITKENNNKFNNTFEKIIHITHDFNKPLQQCMAEQLGFENYVYIRPKIDSFKNKRPLKDKYITFGIHSTLQMKYWNHPDGKDVQKDSPYWDQLCKLLKKNNITPVCLELHNAYGKPPHFNVLPKNSINKVGMPLEDVVNYIEHSEFYIGLSSGMTWVAHALGKPVAMIANFTEDWNEFDINCEDYKRITNKEVCHGCWHTEHIDISNWDNCPKYENTNRQFECHTSITPEQVFNKIKDWI